MLKVNEFEHGIDTATPNTKWDITFNHRANAWFNYSDAAALTQNLDDLAKMIDEFEKIQVPRLSTLATYSQGGNYGIANRPNRIETKKADHRARHDYGGFIATFNTGYLFGIPVKTETDNEDEQAEINRINILNETDQLNADLGYDCSRFGRAYELHYRNHRDEDRVVLSSVFDTFCIYSEDVEHRLIAAVRLIRITRNHEHLVKIDLYTDTEIIHFRETKMNEIILIEEDREQHFYKKVPIIEWYNNRFRHGDYESVISQIDLYDASQSDTANYMHDLNDAMLVLKGNLANTGLSPDKVAAMKDANILLLESATDIDGREQPLDAYYIYKQYDVAGTEAYKNRLQEDIHKFSYTPDFTDAHFAANASGVAMKYKLLGTEQIRSMKERAFTKAIRSRYKLIDAVHASLSEQRIDADRIKVIFTENMPIDYWADIQAYMTAGGQLSQKTLLGQLAWVDNADDELKRINEEAAGAVHDFTLERSETE